MQDQSIRLKNVRVHNLKGIHLTLPSHALIVFTGVSGSGKSSLAFDTIYVEGQRRYISSLSHYARRHLGDLKQPEADLIEGISPTVAIEQKTIGKNPRSTVGTMTGIYDYLRVLFARVGTPHCPISQEPLTLQNEARILQSIANYPNGSKLIFLAPYIREKKGEFKELFAQLLHQGFMRIRLDATLIDLSLSTEHAIDKTKAHDIDLVIDRLILGNHSKERLAEAVTQTLQLGKGLLILLDQQTGKETLFSKYAYAKQSKHSYPPLEPYDFSFNHPIGMCAHCEGLGMLQDFDFNQIINPGASIAEDCCSIASAYQTIKWGNIYRNLAQIYGFSVHTPWKHLPKKAQDIFLYGSEEKSIKMHFTHPSKGITWTEYIQWKGVIHEAKKRLSLATSEHYRSHMEELMQEQVCPKCLGSRLKPYPSATQIGGKRIQEVTALTIQEVKQFMKTLKLPPFETKVAEDLKKEIIERLDFLLEVGLSYLSLDRRAPTLSGGEAQRVRLASQIGAGLVQTTYILDEPSIGLHPRDQTRLIATLKKLRDKGNTVIVVEHDQATIEAADYLVDIGPKAGSLGGEIVAQGSTSDLIKNKRSLTGAYLSGARSMPTRDKTRLPTAHRLVIEGALHHNLKGINVSIPLGLFIGITGVSGSGKSSLIMETLYPALIKCLDQRAKSGGHYRAIKGANHLNKVIAIDQTPIGRTPRSNPSTYIKVFDAIRMLFAELPHSQVAGYQAGRFSFNVSEGSCLECKGMGMLRIDMDFLEDIWTVCPTCLGRRFDPSTLEILYKGKNIHDVLEMTVEDACLFFSNIPSIHHSLSFLIEVGLGYLKLGQSSTTLSGGEAQRVKLARELMRPERGQTLYILDEPTTGLHFDDMHKLILILQQLVDRGHTVIVIEHNMDLIQTTDWIIDLGPEGGEKGGEIIFEGTPALAQKQDTPTGRALRETLTTSKRNKKQRPPKKDKREDALHAIQIKGCRQNNLKDLSLTIPHHQIVALSGPSGSGKTSLAFETLYAEGQRRYTHSLSPYARQFVKHMPPAKVDQIDGLCPSIAIEQKHHAGNPRSTVGTITEIYDFIRLLFTHLGTPYCPETGEKIESITKEFVVKRLLKLPNQTPLHILSPIEEKNYQDPQKMQESLLKKGFVRMRIDGKYVQLDEPLPLQEGRKQALFLVIDRLMVRQGVEKRLGQAIEQATALNKDGFIVATPKEDLFFNLTFAVPSTGKSYPPITPRTFSFNAKEGMCPECLGLGFQWGANILRHAFLMKLSSYDLIDRLWQQDNAKKLLMHFLEKENIDPSTPLYALSPEKLHVLLNGSKQRFSYHHLQLRWIGLNQTFAQAAYASNKELKYLISPFLETTPCLSCQQERLNPLARFVRIDSMTIGHLSQLPLNEALAFIQTLDRKKQLGEVIDELISRLTLLCDMGLDYLSLSRSAPTLSGGETQRLYLARQLGSHLTGCLYVLDEPTIGLHPHNNARINQALQRLCSLGNTLVLVEHDPLTLQIADYLFDFGPRAGHDGGHLIAQGTLNEIRNNSASLTGNYLSGKKTIPIPLKRRQPSKWLQLHDITKYNLKHLTLSIPLQVLACITGVSGAGKSTLLFEVIKKGVEIHLASHSKNSSLTVDGGRLEGLNHINQLITIDQNPIGHTKRANVATYADIFTPLRHFFSELPEAQIHGLEPKHFSYNHVKGMCSACFGLGMKTIHLQFLPDLKVVCDDCHGNRLNPLSLQVTYKGKNLGEILNLTVRQAKEFLPPIPMLIKRLDALIQVGLDYVQLGQTIASLSGGEAGRLRLSRELAKRTKGKTLYLFDEPTIGLHSCDIAHLLPLFHALVDQGHTVWIIEHHLDVIQNADYLIDLGPEAGEGGGKVAATGTPEEVAKQSTSHTACYLSKHLSSR